MNRFLLFAAAAGISLAAAAQSPFKVTDKAVESHVKAPLKAEATSVARVKKVTSTDGIFAKKAIAAPFASLKLNAKAAPARRAEGADDTVLSEDVLFESFESWDGEDNTWVPDGWTVEAKGDEQSDYYYHWFPSTGGAWFPAVTDGKYYYGVIFGTGKQDEWLISPEVQMPDSKDMVLSYDMNISPVWFYSMDNVDWSTYEYVGEKEIVFDVKVLVSVDGGEWETLVDYAQNYLDYSYYDLAMMETDKLDRYTYSMEAYAGKKIKIAFQFVGTDNNSIFVDHIRIGLPELDTPVYMMPLSTQYVGTDLEFSSTDFACGFLPVYTPLTWEIYDPQEVGTYTWEYHAPDTNGDELATAQGTELTLTYTPDYTSEFTTRNNLYYSPTVTLSASGGAPASYKNPTLYTQMGGYPEFMFTNGSSLKAGVMPMSISTYGLTFTTYDEDEFGVDATPVFGYNVNTDKYWTDYTFHGEEEPGEYAKLKGILNYIVAPESPMVVTGAHLDARGRGIGDDVTFYCRIVYLNEEGEVYPEDATMATASCKATDIILQAEGGMNNYYTIPFTFDTPVVLDNSRTAYVIEVYGFNDSNIEYFAPLQTAYPALDVPLYIGWVRKEFSFAGEIRDSYSAMARVEGDFGPCFNAFAISMDATYPWLHSELDEVTVDEGENLISLDSYYDAADLTVTAPDWATATISGRYADTQLTITATATEEDRTGQLVVEGTGVKKAFTLKQTGISGINEIISTGDNTIEAIYNLNGQRVNSANLPAGIYMIKRASGKVEKVRI